MFLNVSFRSNTREALAYRHGICRADGGGGRHTLGRYGDLSIKKRDRLKENLMDALLEIGLTRLEINEYWDARFEINRLSGIASGDTPAKIFAGNEYGIAKQLNDAIIKIIYLEERFQNLRKTYKRIMDVPDQEDQETKPYKPRNLIFLPEGKAFILSQDCIDRGICRWTYSVRTYTQANFITYVLITPENIDRGTMQEIEESCVVEDHKRRQ